MTKVEMWIRRVIKVITFGHSEGWWKEKPTILGKKK